MKHRTWRKGAKAFFCALAFMLALGASPVFAQQENLDDLSTQGDYQFSPEELQQLQGLYGAQGESSSSGSLDDYSSGISDSYGTYDGGSPYGSIGQDPTGLSLLSLLFGGLGGEDSSKSLLLFFGIYSLLLLVIAIVYFISVFKKYKRFSREHALVFGWNTMKKQIWLFVLISIVQLFVWVIIGLLAYFAMMKYGQATLAPVWIAGLVLGVFVPLFLLFSVGQIKISLKAHDGKAFGVGDLFGGINRVFKYFLAGIVYFLIVAGPFVALQILITLVKDQFSPLVLAIGGLVATLLLAIPVSIWLMKFSLWGIVVVDKGVWPLRAFKLSSQYMARAKTDVALFGILLFGINLVGINIPLMLGLFVTLPTTMLAYAHMYRQLEKGS